MQFLTPPDITGDGAVHTLASITGLNATKCKWFQFLGISIASSAVPGRLGDASISLDVASPATSGRGIIIPAGGGEVAYPIALMSDLYDLTAIYYVLAVGDKAQIAVAV